MSKKTPEGTEPVDPAAQLEEAISEVGHEILASVEGKAEGAIETATTKAEAKIASVEDEITKGEAQAMTEAALPPSTRQAYRALAFGAPPATPAAGDAGGPPIGPVPKGPSDTSALDPAVVQSVEFQNQEIKDYAPTMIVTPPDQMIGQAAGLAAQSAAQYFDSVTKLVMASQSVMLKKMSEDLVAGNIATAAEDGLIIAETELLLAGAMAVAAAGGAMEAASASFGISKINESVQARQAQARK
ncbi:hypothetical protein [Ruegeria aquimaris]|uniref:Phasin protein n=1 Tax=Ruegeria aquimaris TaxID=2984333 RepID=A0ABT3AM12_9RHOB|nr:hypothetical protein [Ruegeria sp. XHP0148]MCV2889156.1 hypothetical protein [Ruegeria sp. XHP0148]